MPLWLTEALKLLGFTTPFVYAAATYGLFLWLDRKASKAAKDALTSWLKVDRKPRVDATNLVTDLFDKVYTTPLLSLKAFARSVLITLVVILLVWYETGHLHAVAKYVSEMPATDGQRMVVARVIIVGFTILSDYISLFFVRRMLVWGQSRPLLSMLTGPIVGLVIVFLAVWLRMLVLMWLVNPDLVFRFLGRVDPVFWLQQLTRTVANVIVLPAFVVHLWLPLMAIAIGMTKGIYWVAKAAGAMQWFLKQGQLHPFQAVGLVAAIIVFAVSAVIQMLTR